jgi:hypothetical protein
MKFPFIGPAYFSRSARIEAQECINLYLEVDPNGRNALLGTPGLRLFAALGSGPLRGAWKIATGDLIAVAGNAVYRVRKDASATFLGSVGTSSGPVSIADNGQQCLIVDGSSTGYQITLPDYTLSAIVSDAFYGADNVYFLDGRFVLNRPGTGQFYLSDLYATTFNALYFATAETSPDNLVSHIVDHREIWLFGDLTTEVWVANGAPTFPYERMEGAAIEAGCAAAHSVCKMDNSIVWLGKDEKGQGIVWLVANYTPVRISTHALETAIASYAKAGTISDAIAYVYQQEGHTFYVLTFPSAQRTWAYDAATKTWAQRAYLDSTGQQVRHRSNCHAFAWGMNLVGDYANGNLYVLDLDTYTDNGDPIRRVRSCAPVIGQNFEWIYFDDLQVEFEAGVGLVDGQGADPQAMLTCSDDGGRTWGNERTASIGQIGEFDARVRWTRLGRSRNRVFRIAVSDPVKIAIVNSALNAGGAS